MKTLLHAVAVGFLLICGYAVAQTPVWTQFPNSPAGTVRNDDIFFANLTNGWSARGTDGVYRTMNGGNAWIKVIPNISPVAHFRCIGFASATHGWAGNLGPGSYDGSVTDTNMLYETFDGGTTWNSVPAINTSGMAGFCAMHVMDVQHIYGVGRVRGPAYFAKSENGGSSWWITNLTAAGVMGGLMDVYFKDTTNGFVVGMDTNAYNTTCAAPFYHGAIARTTNGGLSWFVVTNTTINCSYFWKMSWPSANVGYASLQQNTTYSTVVFFKTIDGGATWVSNGIPLTAIGGQSSFGLQGIGFVSDTEGWMGGSTVLNPPYSYIHTTNGGVTWTPEGYDNTRGMNRIRFVSPALGYGSGQKLHVFRVPLAITSQPTNQTVAIGATATFSVAAQGYAPLSYQWRFSGTNLAGATSSNYSALNAQAANAGNYDVVVSDYAGSIMSVVTTLSLIGVAVPPNITVQPQNVVINPSSNANFTVTATGTSPLRFQWRFNNANLSGATNTGYTRTNAQSADVGNYTVVVTNSAGSVTSVVATLTLAFVSDFDSYVSPVIVTNIGTTNGCKIFFNAAAGGLDFKVIFGFEYSAVTFPTNIPSAPHSIGGTTKGLYVTVNKDATPGIAAVNLYPTGASGSGNFALKFDLWLNGANLGTSTEHALFGINHSGIITNRIGLATSDGLMFAVDTDGNVSATTGTIRDYAIYRGGGSGAIPIFTTNSPTFAFGPTPLLGPQFDNLNPGISSLFPSKSIPGWGNTLAGSAGLGWVSVEVRQVNNLITWLLNSTAIAQYTNTTTYINGSVMIGYNDTFSSVGDSNSFAIFDNVRIEPITIAPVNLLSPQMVENNFNFSFATEAYESYTVQQTTNLASSAWLASTNIVGNGSMMSISIPLTPGNSAAQYFRVSRP